MFEYFNDIIRVTIISSLYEYSITCYHIFILKIILLQHRYETSTPGGDITRDQDFGYEVIDHSSGTTQQQILQQISSSKFTRDDMLDQLPPQAATIQEEDSLAEQYRGTPPLKSKKKKHDRRSHEISDHVSRFAAP